MHWLDPDYLPLTTGIVERFTINLDGDIDGLLLTDQTLIHSPPHLSDRVKSAVRAGDSVRVRGVKPRGADLIAAVLPTGTAIHECSVSRAPALSSTGLPCGVCR